tara:strand:- start:7059 stop:7658 length:600 start_codon:yes stop_codon:yes gene_type:complete
MDFNLDTKHKSYIEFKNNIYSKSDIEIWYNQSGYNLDKMIPLFNFINNNNIDTSNSNIVDIGSGKGYALYKFMEYNNFKKYIGIEFNKEYYDICLNNFNILKNEKNICYKINNLLDIKYINAINYEFEINDNFIYMFNPFGKKTMTQIIHNLKKTKKKQNINEYYIIYDNPIHNDILINNNFIIIYNGFKINLYKYLQK